MRFIVISPVNQRAFGYVQKRASDQSSPLAGVEAAGAGAIVERIRAGAATRFRG
jgi:hypothetical protein